MNVSEEKRIVSSFKLDLKTDYQNYNDEAILLGAALIWAFEFSFNWMMISIFSGKVNLFEQPVWAIIEKYMNEFFHINGGNKNI